MNPVIEVAARLDATPGNTAFTTWNAVAFDIFDESTWDFHLDDIANALSNICRFGGHVRFYSVAEHCVRVSRILEEWGWDPALQRLGLFHDAAEAYIGDIVRPIKKTFTMGGHTVLDLETRLEKGIFDKFVPNVHTELSWSLVKDADMEAYRREAMERPTPGEGLPPYAAKDLFLARERELV